MKKFLWSLIIILVAFLAIAITFMALSPKNMTYEAEQTIDAPPHMVYNLVNDFTKWTLWSPVMQLDPETINTYSDLTMGPGARWSWKGNELVGEGQRKIIEAIEAESIKTEIEFSGIPTISRGQWIFTKDGDKTRVTWAYEGGDTAFPFRPFNVMYKRGFKKTYQKGLDKLKEVAEQRAKNKMYRGYQINDDFIDARIYLMNRQEVRMENVQQFYAQNLGALFMKAQKSKMTMDGMPSGLFFNDLSNSNTVDMAAAIPVEEEKSVEGAQMLNVPEGRAVQVNYYGDYSGISEAHAAIEDYIRDYGLLKTMPVVEEYMTDPGEEKDPSKWLTRIIYYIQDN
ncbi:MAG: hypothetical protein HKN09_02435 [Saprospiraceae bacterium]|nr:hypothetical protein [Saprospiraceae bacterium]